MHRQQSAPARVGNPQQSFGDVVANAHATANYQPS